MERPKQLVQMDGDTFEVTVFNGDGKAYDALTKPTDPTQRLGSMLFRRLSKEEFDALQTQPPETSPTS